MMFLFRYSVLILLTIEHSIANHSLFDFFLISDILQLGPGQRHAPGLTLAVCTWTLGFLFAMPCLH